MSSLSELVARNHKKLKEVATNITKNRSLADDLINETYILIEKRYKTLPDDDISFVKVYASLMKFQAIPEKGERHRTSDYQRLISPKEVNITDFSFYQEEDSGLTDKVTKEILLADIVRFKQTLNSLELILFDLRYERGLKFTDIVRLYSDHEHEMSVNCLWQMYLPLKKKLKDFKWNI